MQERGREKEGQRKERGREGEREREGGRNGGKEGERRKERGEGRERGGRENNTCNGSLKEKKEEERCGLLTGLHCRIRDVDDKKEHTGLRWTNLEEQ